MEFIREYQTKPLFSLKARTIRVYKQSIEEIKAYYRRSEYMTFVKRTDKNFIFSFTPYVKKEAIFKSYKVGRNGYVKRDYIGTNEKVIDYNGAKEYKLCPISHEYIQFTDEHEFVGFGNEDKTA
jgi:hypothetical protein